VGERRESRSILGEEGQRETRAACKRGVRFSFIGRGIYDSLETNRFLGLRRKGESSSGARSDAEVGFAPTLLKKSGEGAG